MTWRCFLCDVMTGLLGAEVEIPSFSWSVTVSDSSFDTTADKGTGEFETDRVTLPWTALPGDTPQQRGAEVAEGRRGLVLCWEDSSGMHPIVFGAIGARTDTREDTSFSLDSPLTILGDRYAVKEGVFGASKTTNDDGEVINGTTRSTVYYEDMSLRGIAAEVGRLCTSKKEAGGTLPIDWNYLGEEGSHERTYKGYNVQNISCADIWDKLANVTGGPDMQLRPYMSDDSHVRLEFLAGSDADVYIGQDSLTVLTEYNDLTVEHATPYMRVYETGAGSEEEMICALAEDLDLCETLDPVPLRECCNSDSDDDSLAEVESAAEAYLEASKVPLAQVSLTVDASALPLGSAWPGEVFRVPIDNFPTLPDGDYDLRLMEMSGDEGRLVDCVFDVFEDPAF